MKKKIASRNFSYFWIPITQNSSNQGYQSLDSSRPHGRVLENQKTGDSRELFLPENGL